jgi:hypothetical protein
MKIEKKDLVDSFDNKFIKVLKKVYLDKEPVSKKALAQKIFELLVDNNYSPSVPKFIIDYDKGHGVSRPVPIFNPIDYGVYYFCMKRLEENIAYNRVEGTFGGWSLGGKLRKLEEAEIEVEDIDYPMTQSLNPTAWSKYYGDYNSKLLGYIADLEGYEYLVVEIDIANFYDTIRLDILESKLRMVSKKENSAVINLLFHFLKNSNKQIHSFNSQLTGIPQDMIADCSRLLANFYLQDYDLEVSEYCKENRIQYLRYADDQVFFIPKELNYKEVVKFCSNRLYKIGLNINQKKVKVSEFDEFLQYRAFNLYNLLDPGVTNENQSNDVATRFTNASVEAILNDNRELNNNGAALLRKIIGVGVNKLPNDLRSVVLSIALSKNFLSYLDHRKLSQLYMALDASQKKEMIIALSGEALVATQSAFFYECAKFSNKHKLGLSNFNSKVDQDNKTWTTE